MTTPPTITRTRRKRASRLVPAPPQPVPAELLKLVRQRMPSQRKLLEQSLLMRQVNVRRGKSKWAVVDKENHVVFEAASMVLANAVIHSLCGWITGKLLVAGPPATLPGVSAFRITITGNQFTCAISPISDSFPIHTAGFVVLHNDGKATAYYPNHATTLPA